MRALIVLATLSAWNRRYTLGLTLLAVALSVMLLLGVERLRHDAREGFSQAVSGTDLVVGARASPVQLMLYAVFRIGETANNMRWESFRWLAAQPQVAWTVPLSLGDSHSGFPVLGTTADYFERFRHGRGETLAFADGRPFVPVFETVIGAAVAAKLGYRAGDRIVLSHGTGGAAVADHGDKPFTVVGVLRPTGTPVDRTLHVPLEAIEALHLDWQGGVPLPGMTIPAEFVTKFDLQPKAITAALVGLKNRAAVFRVQRTVNEYGGEPLSAVLPGVALDQLWQTIAVAERALLAVSAMVVVVGLAGLIAVILAGLNERRRELAILRSVGARPATVFALLSLEGFAVTVIGAAAGVLLLAALSALLGPLAAARFGIAVEFHWLTAGEVWLLGAVVAAGMLASLLPGYRAYKMSLADGLTPRT